MTNELQSFLADNVITPEQFGATLASLPN